MPAILSVNVTNGGHLPPPRPLPRGRTPHRQPLAQPAARPHPPRPNSRSSAATRGTSLDATPTTTLQSWPTWCGLEARTMRDVGIAFVGYAAGTFALVVLIGMIVLNPWLLIPFLLVWFLWAMKNAPAEPAGDEPPSG